MQSPSFILNKDTKGPLPSQREWKSWHFHPCIDPQKRRTVTNRLLPSNLCKYSLSFCDAHFELCMKSLITDEMIWLPGEERGGGWTIACFFSWFSKFALTYCNSAAKLDAFSVIDLRLTSSSSFLEVRSSTMAYKLLSWLWKCSRLAKASDCYFSLSIVCCSLVDMS